MLAAIIKENIIINIIEVPDGAAPENYGAIALPEGKNIGEAFDDTPTFDDVLEYQTDLDYRINLLEMGVTE